ncbi:hypothetical protein Pmar_PMAR005073 [Perkinsus marinus ATCC 50983]|uniref:Uncharacterized protein n=1 Tax=Perkinsus marinus (strain ATCC 50983 / TXsc) TaxID=423536 RepID=C5KVJ7_PERM5|nr:hypothetical protein Pmar_PMAR005073 [Perkinsus marinus ATCC 50983]EER11496.1 hypothetical protein Pmar_PMAR005073 [Perkinsus marinus ATCC 50983]|eukprot:XP_002779701.1 hypothetical protein Pmar_PMAR005073 [Perkinsus marinus ATCC 50983]
MHALEAAYAQDRSETRRVVKHIIGTLPPRIATEVIREIKQTVGLASAMSRRMAMDCDWELLLPFVPSFDPRQAEQMSVSDIIRDVCRTIESADPSSQSADRVAYADEKKAREGNSQVVTQKDGSKGKIPLDSWAKGYAVVYVIRSQSSEKRLDSEAIKRELDPDIIKFIRGKKQPLALIGYTEVTKGKAAVEKSSAKQEYSIRPFQFRARSGNE